MKLVTIIGARPQFIKSAALSNALKDHPDIEELIVHTGQHYDPEMSKVFFKELNIPEPKYNLGIGSGNHGLQTGRMLEEIERVLLTETPNAAIVYGDTNSTLAGALASCKLHIPIAHVEAGLRSFNRKMPEEINRILTDHCSNILFTPTKTATANLITEGVDKKNIYQIGDVMYDVSLILKKKAEQKSNILSRLKIKSNRFILCTIHRAENTNVPYRIHSIVEALKKLTKILPVILPLHPRTKRVLEQLNLLNNLSNSITIIDPVGYLDITMLEKHAAVIVTDSGGMQKEAFFFKTPCVTLRDETEWIELVEAGWNQIVPPNDPSEIVKTIEQSLNSTKKLDYQMIYGDGTASNKIIPILKQL